MADVGRTEVKVGAEALRKGSRNGDEDEEITADTMKRPRAAEGWLMKRRMPTTRVMVLLGMAVGSRRGVGEDVWGKEISSVRQVCGANGLAGSWSNKRGGGASPD